MRGETMRKEHLDIICCPVCRGEMDLQVIKTSRDEIIEGTLTCDTCKNQYFIRNGTAYLVPAGVSQESSAHPFFITRKQDPERNQ
jgi:uncharacterized protein